MMIYFSMDITGYIIIAVYIIGFIAAIKDYK